MNNMKKLFSMMFVLASMVFVFTSCSVKNYMQIVDIKSSGLNEQTNNWGYSDENCKITYNFWSNAGEVSFHIENLTDEILYIDLGKSFFTRNGRAYDYFLNRTFESGKSSSFTSGVSRTASAYGFWSLTGHAGKVSASASFSNTNGSFSSTKYNEKEILAIPPHSVKNIAEYNIAGDVIQNCSVALFPKKNKPQSITYAEDESPLKFSNYITYKVGENGALVSLTHDFHVSGYTNYLLSETEENVKVGCKEQNTIKVNKYGKTTKYYYIYNKKHDNSNSYYIYNKKHDNSNSADAKAKSLYAY